MSQQHLLMISTCNVVEEYEIFKKGRLHIVSQYILADANIPSIMQMETSLYMKSPAIKFVRAASLYELTIFRIRAH